MKIRQSICVIAFCALITTIGWAQSDSAPQGDAAQPGPIAPQSDSPQAETTAPPAAPAIGQDNPPPAPADNPPISGLDQPSLEPQVPVRSFLQPGARVSEAVDSNVGGTLGNSSTSSVTRALGTLLLQRFWNRYETVVGFAGGGAFYTRHAKTFSQIEQLEAEQKMNWRTGALAVRDAFSYLPEGAFGAGSFGGEGGLGGVGNGGGITGAGEGFFGPGQFASLGQAPRITNVAIMDVVQSLSPRTSVTLTGAYGLVHYTDGTALVNGISLLDSRQTSAQAGYNYQLNRKDQIALVYGFQEFRYPGPVGSSFTTQLVNALYGHRISGRLDFVIGGGPQFIETKSFFSGSTRQISGSGRVSLRYKFPQTQMDLTYFRYTTSGSGFFAGATTDLARISASRPIARRWTAMADIGYAHSSRLGFSIFGVPAQSDSYVYAGGSVKRQLGRDFSAFLSYQFNDLWFDQSFCAQSATGCSRTSQRSVALIGLDWHPHAIRLD
ncbi:MAG: hypothetical protein JOY93_01585 [Acidobacteriales bacterium]|nr:hypothetical protein [Terriglobales bacterium]